MSKEKFDLDPAKLTYLLEIRGMTQVGLAEKAGISRTSVNQYCSGNQKPSVNTVHRLATALKVQFTDLKKVENEEGKVGDVGELIKEVENLLKSAYPLTLKKNLSYIKLLLNHYSKEQSEILDYAMIKTNQLGLTHLRQFIHNLEAYPQMYREFASVINVYYVQNEEDPCEYECLVKFEPWVYEFFSLDDDNQFITIRIEEEKESSDWDSDMIDQLQCYYTEQVSNLMEDDLGDAFIELLDCGDWKWPEELIFEDYDPLKELKIELKTIRLQKLFEKLRADGKGYDVLAKAAVDDKFAETLFEEYEMNDK